MRASKIICIMAACLLMTAMPSCANSNQDSSSTSSSKPVLFRVYADIPEDKDYIPIYSMADTTSGGVTPVYFNEELNVIGENGDWYEVDCNGFIGYIQKSFTAKQPLPEENRPVRTRASTTTTTTTATSESKTTAEGESETTTSVTTTGKDKDKNKDKDKDKSETSANSSEETTTAAQQAEETTATTARLPASAYPDIDIYLNINENGPDSGKYDITLTLDGRFSNYVYELHRIFADGTDTLIASGESSETNIKLATIDSLTESQTVDRLIMTAYYNSVPGNKVTLDLNEPKK